MLANTQSVNPAKVEIIHKMKGGKRILVNGIDVSPITRKYEIIAEPCNTDYIRLTIPIERLSVHDE
jgi:hypothetical protein